MSISLLRALDDGVVLAGLKATPSGRPTASLDPGCGRHRSALNGGPVRRRKRQNQVSTVSGDCRDIGKAELVCCVRVPGGPGKSKRVQEVITYRTMTRSLLRMVDRLRELAVTRVVMEATSDYWKPPFYLLEAAGFETWLVNAKDVKHLPGRPKTDRLDAV